MRWARPVSEVPWVELVDWSAARLANGKVKLVGYDTAARDGRVSTTVIHFDAATRTATTRSGRKYLLAGEPGRSEAGWRLFQAIWGGVDFVDATGEFL